MSGLDHFANASKMIQNSKPRTDPLRQDAMTATIHALRQSRRTHVARQCDAVSLAEALAIQSVRWWAAYTRDQMRYWWGV